MEPTAVNVCALKDKISKMSIEECEARLDWFEKFCIQYGTMSIIEITLLTDRVLEINHEKTNTRI